MIQERLEAACWVAELRRKGTLLSDQAVAEVCEALLELAGVGTITLELHERVLAEERRRVVVLGAAANRRIEELERQLADTEESRRAEIEHANRWAARAHAAEAELHRLKTLEGSP